MRGDTEMSIDPAVAALLERQAIEDTLYAYAARIDMRDHDGVRATFTDDIVAEYGNNGTLEGADEVIRYIHDFTEEALWEHHFINVYTVDVEGDTAKALIYHTSHQMFATAPGVVHRIVGRYHNELRRTPEGWKISRLLLEILWADRRTDDTGYLDDVNGTGPRMPQDLHKAPAPAG
jgi:ketosteroid isomerase-like protein